MRAKRCSGQHSVYKLTSPKGKVYIGCTGEKPEDRWSKGYVHNSELSNDIREFGFDNFEHEVVRSNLHEDNAYELEKELIHKYNSTNPDYGYNKSTGGRYNYGHSFKHTEEARKKISEAGIGRRHTEESKRKLSEGRRGENNPMYGKHPSEETRRKLSEARRGENNPRYGVKQAEPINTRPKRIMCVETGKIYDSINKASIDTGWSVSYISLVCSGKRNSTSGYHWKYVD